MISLIICSRSKDIQKELRDNVEKTIGTEHEWVIVDNSSGCNSIFQAYNIGISRAKGDILCFMHDDILFRTMNWGLIVREVLNESNVGLVGLVGNYVIPDCPASWWTSCFKAGIVTQHYETDQIEKLNYGYPHGKSVALVDGLWFCMLRTAFKKVHFDEETFHGFHCYDSDICMQILALGMEVRLVENIDIVHLSDGNLNDEFFHAREQWYKKWQKSLPISRGVELSQREINILTLMAKEENDWTIKASRATAEIARLQSTRAYQIGKFLLRHFRIHK